MLAKIKDILIIVNKGEVDQFKKVLPNGKNLGIKITYAEQESPRGLPDAFIVGEKFIGNSSVALILGDNFFYGQSLTKKLIQCTRLIKGAKVFLHQVKNPSLYGVAKINKKNKIINIAEKPKNSSSNLAITGLYFFDNRVIEFSKTLKPSKRKEIEIVDLLNKYKKRDMLSAEIIGRGATWLDTGSIKDYNNTSSFISTIQNRQGFKIGCLEEVAFNNKWIQKRHVLSAITFYGKCDYTEYLKIIIN